MPTAEIASSEIATEEAEKIIQARLIAFMLPSSPYSTQMARFYCRAALRYHGLGEFVDDAEMVISELATNAIAQLVSSLGVVVSRTLGSVAEIYATPIWAHWAAARCSARRTSTGRGTSGCSSCSKG